jgi:hypothetical protein
MCSLASGPVSPIDSRIGLADRGLGAMGAEERLRLLTAWSRCVVEGVVGVAGEGSVVEGGPS